LAGTVLTLRSDVSTDGQVSRFALRDALIYLYAHTRFASIKIIDRDVPAAFLAMRLGRGAP